MHVTSPQDLAIARVLRVANTSHGPGGHYRVRATPGEPAHDHLASAAEARTFLGEHGFTLPGSPPTAVQLEGLRAIRRVVISFLGTTPELVPDLATAGALTNPQADPPAWAAPVVSLFEAAAYRLVPDGRLRSRRRGWNAILDDLLPELIRLAGERDRLRRCANELCGYLFVDRSRNVSRIWCEMAVCGNRVKVRRHRSANRDEERRPARSPTTRKSRPDARSFPPGPSRST